MRYMGSKRRFVKEFLPIILDGMDFGDTFVDACCGGCNVISEVPQTYRRVANDINPYLIGMWRLVVSGAELPKDITAELYNDVRRSYYARDGRYSDGYIGWVGYMASFNGRFFEAGYAARTRGRDYIDEGIRNIMRQRAKMTGVEFTCQDLYVTPPDSLQTYFFDPPYKGTKEYARDGRHFDHERFCDYCRMLKEKGHRVFVSEYSMPDDFRCVWSKETKCCICPANPHNTTEKLFTL